MSTSVVVAVLAVAISALLLAWSLGSAPSTTRVQALHNLQRGTGVDRGAAGARHATERGTRLQPLLRTARALTPRAGTARLQRLLTSAGRPAAWPVERVLVTKMVLASSACLLGLWLVATELSARTLVLATVMVALGWFVPEILLYNVSTKRRQRIERALPDVLDQLTIAVEAGLGFEAGLAHVGRNSGGPLGDELIRTLQDIQVGATRRAAYTSLAERAQVEDLSRFVRAIMQAEQYGVSIATVLEAQAQEMRLKRRQRAEEKALQIPVKVVFPLVLFILPTIFIVVLGPAVVTALQSFPMDAFRKNF